MKKYEVFMGATSCTEVARREISNEDDLPNLQDEDVVYPCDMGAGSDVCADLKTAQIWFVDKDGNEVKRFSLDPSENKDINVIDGGEIFDESDPTKTFLYFELGHEDVEWSCGTIETDDEIVPSNVSVTIRRYVNADGETRELLDPSALKFNGQDLCGDCNGGEGTCGKSFWVLHDGKRKSVDVELGDE